MKARRPHVVPLPVQAVAILEGMRAVTGPRALVFASPYQPWKMMSENTLNVALASPWYRFTIRLSVVHGGKSMSWENRGLPEFIAASGEKSGRLHQYGVQIDTPRFTSNLLSEQHLYRRCSSVNRTAVLFYK